MVGMFSSGVGSDASFSRLVGTIVRAEPAAAVRNSARRAGALHRVGGVSHRQLGRRLPRTLVPWASLLRALIAVLGILPLCMGLGTETSAQQSTSSPRSSSFSVPRELDAAGTAPLLLDAPIGRTEYLLGPGDVIDLSIFGELNVLHRLPVTPEGTVVIPTVGVVDVLDLNLDQAQTRVSAAVLRYFRNVGIHLTISQIRSFKVFVVGDVPLPGVRIASAATRVSEVLPFEPDSLREVLPRNVLLRRASGEAITVDLVRFRQTGDLSANPTLREGDALVVPMVDRTVRVYGRVSFPGVYEHRSGESLAQLLGIANGGGGFPVDASDSIRVSRAVDRSRQQVYSFTQAEAAGDRGQGFVLEPFDAVYVPEISDYRRQHSATVEGQVLYPGTYPIQPDTTTVRDLVAMAGGFAPDASLTSASLRRQPQGDNGRRLRQLQNVPPELLTSQERRVLQAGTQGNDTHVVIDFQRLFVQGEDAYNQVLRGGDTLSVPRRQEEVAILGAVLQPGLVQHVPGQNVRHFVQLAGGYSRKADRGDVVVIKAGSGSRIDAGEVRSVDPGDAIVVPFKERRDYLRALQTTSTVVTTVTGLVLTFLAFVR